MARRLRWAVAQTKPNQEALAARNIHNQDHEFFLPRYWDERLKRRRVLFVGYIMALVNPESYSFLHSTRGIKAVLDGFVPHADVARFRSLENENGVILLPRTDPRSGFAKNQKVRITEGPFFGEHALYQEMSNRDFAKVLVSILKRETVVYVEPRALAAL